MALEKKYIADFLQPYLRLNQIDVDRDVMLAVNAVVIGLRAEMTAFATALMNGRKSLLAFQSRFEAQQMQLALQVLVNDVDEFLEGRVVYRVPPLRPGINVAERVNTIHKMLLPSANQAYDSVLAADNLRAATNGIRLAFESIVAATEFL